VRKSALVLVLAALALSVPRLAWAEGQNRVVAESLFEEGRRLVAQGNFAEAAQKFEASHELDSGVGTLLYLGECQEKLGLTASAWASFKEAESLADVRGDRERWRIAQTRATALATKLPRLVVRVAEAHKLAGMVVRVGNAAIPPASWNSPVFHDPGSHRVRVEAPGRVAWSSTVVVQPSITSAVEVPLLERPRTAGAKVPRALPLTTADPLADQAGVGRTQRFVGLALGGVGVSGLAAGAVLGMQAASRNDESLEECPRSRNLCSPQGVKLRSEAENYARASNIAFAAGGGVALAGIVVYLTSPSGASPAQSKALALSGSATPSSGRLILRGRF
jgi:hypothetical protein